MASSSIPSRIDILTSRQGLKRSLAYARFTGSFEEFGVSPGVRRKDICLSVFKFFVEININCTVGLCGGPDVSVSDTFGRSVLCAVRCEFALSKNSREFVGVLMMVAGSLAATQSTAR